MSGTIAVLRKGVHGIPTEEYAAVLRGRLPGWEIVHATTPQEEYEAVETATVVTGFALQSDLLERADDVAYFQGLYAGADHLPLSELEAKDVTVTTAAGVHGPNAAEQAIGYLLALTRGFPEAFRRQTAHEWRHFRSLGELQGSTVTVVGLGSIGEAIVERLSGFGVHTIGVRYTPSKGGPTDEVIGFDEVDLQDAYAQSDYLVLACPLTETTEGLIDTEALRTLPPDAVLVNIARGEVVETDALVSALRGNQIHAAALDVTDPEPLPEDHPLWTLENAFITPHTAGYTPEYYERVADILEENLSRAAESGRYDGLVNQVVPSPK